MQSKEQGVFETLKAEKERIRTECLSVEGEDGQEGSTFIEKDAEETKEILPEYAELAKLNPDFAGWISIEGTNIDYPVMQSLEDREYYLHRDFYGKKSYAGVPFIGSGSLDKHKEIIFVYGHNMKNGTMFADLLKYQKKEFWNAHSYINFDTLYEHRSYQIFTAFYADEKDWNQKDSLLYPFLMHGKITKKDYGLLTMKNVGDDTGTMPEKMAPLLFLVTCSYQENKGRFIVVGMQIN